jgi:hypothetical protein
MVDECDSNIIFFKRQWTGSIGCGQIFSPDSAIPVEHPFQNPTETFGLSCIGRVKFFAIEVIACLPLILWPGYTSTNNCNYCNSKQDNQTDKYHNALDHLLK